MTASERSMTEEVTRRVNAARLERGWTIAHLAESLADEGWSVSHSTLNGILSANKREAYTITELIVLAKTLRVSPGFLCPELVNTDADATRGYRAAIVHQIRRLEAELEAVAS